ncbi:hypothetical protein QUF70_20120 [Desulfobacterales bacterium HSG17]|nr:hypothetical protein [Desulfobacterales bacterium HSG17]
MMRRFNENSMSAYLDGELNMEEMTNEEELIWQCTEAQSYILQNAISTARLRRIMKTRLVESVPNKIIRDIQYSSQGSDRRTGSFNRWGQLIAAMLLLLIGAGLGFQLPFVKKTADPLFPASLPTHYSQVINHALEYELSGKPYHRFEAETKLIVTPVKTFKHKNGKYYREFQLDIISDTMHQRITGLAFRAAPKKWSTTALFFPNHQRKVTI